jgi:hypothetical protein
MEALAQARMWDWRPLVVQTTPVEVTTWNVKIYLLKSLEIVPMLAQLGIQSIGEEKAAKHTSFQSLVFVELPR